MFRFDGERTGLSRLNRLKLWLVRYTQEEGMDGTTTIINGERCTMHDPILVRERIASILRGAPTQIGKCSSRLYTEQERLVEGKPEAFGR